MDKILSIDLGTTFGYAKLIDQDNVDIGSVHLKEKNDGDFLAKRYLRFEDWLQNQQDVDAVIYEKVLRHAGVQAAHCYGGFEAILLMWCEKNNIPFFWVVPPVLKKYTTGIGNANKEKMLEAMRLKGHELEDHNQADALAMLYWFLENKK